MLAKSLDSFIACAPDICGGKPCIAGRRIRVIDIATWHEAQKRSIEDIAADYELSPQQIHAALAYYHENRAEIEAQQAEEDRFVAQMKLQNPSQLETLRKERLR